MIITIVMIVLGIYDFVVVNYLGIDGSISKLFQNTAFDAPLTSYVIGFVCGHIFGYMPHTKITWRLKKQLIAEGWKAPTK